MLIQFYVVLVSENIIKDEKYILYLGDGSLTIDEQYVK